MVSQQRYGLYVVCGLVVINLLLVVLILATSK